MTESTGRPPVRARSGRRPIPPLIALLVLAIVALGVWWNVFRDEATRQEAKADACATASAAPTSLDPATVTLRVFNATDRAGLAGAVATSLESRGFIVSERANDSSEFEVTGVGELRFGARGASTAAFVALALPGATERRDSRADSIVDVVIGPDFTELAPPEQVAAALLPDPSAVAAC
jgi:hypothetical protein